jgi:hypothetical protein
VNLIALSASLSSTWRTRRGSAATRGKFEPARYARTQAAFPRLAAAATVQPFAPPARHRNLRPTPVFAFVARQRDHVVEQGLQSIARIEQHFDVALLRAIEFAALEQLRHAEQRVQRRADLVADIGDEGGFGARVRFGQVALPFRLPLFALEANDKIGILCGAAPRLSSASRDPCAIGIKHAAEKQHEQAR